MMRKMRKLIGQWLSCSACSASWESTRARGTWSGTEIERGAGPTHSRRLAFLLATAPQDSPRRTLRWPLGVRAPRGVGTYRSRRSSRRAQSGRVLGERGSRRGDTGANVPLAPRCTRHGPRPVRRTGPVPCTAPTGCVPPCLRNSIGTSRRFFAGGGTRRYGAPRFCLCATPNMRNVL
jgi:hypothetical protein